MRGLGGPPTFGTRKPALARGECGSGCGCDGGDGSGSGGGGFSGDSITAGQPQDVSIGHAAAAEAAEGRRRPRDGLAVGAEPAEGEGEVGVRHLPLGVTDQAVLGQHAPGLRVGSR